MENRFGVKDFLILTTLLVLVVLVILAMFQYDRQWDDVQAIRNRLDAQGQELREIKDQLRRGVVAVGGGAPGAGPATASAADTFGGADGPFARILAAKEMPGYAQGDWLVDAFGNNVGKLTPLLSSDVYASNVQSYVLESLAERNPDTLEWSPLLAREWEIVDNAKAHVAYVEEQKAAGRSEEEILKDEALPNAIQIRFRMRRGPVFSDGQPVTADDVVFTYDFIMDPAVNAPRQRSSLHRVARVEKTADDEVTFTFREPYFQAFELAASLAVLPKHFYGKFTPEDFNQSVGYLMGSGPYRLQDPTSWKPGTQIQLVRNERYWGVAPAFDRLVWREIPNDVARLQAFRNGDIDVFPALPEQYREMIADPTLVARTKHYEYQNPIGGYRYIAWNQRNPLFADKRVRQALTMLLDRERMIQEIMLGYAVLSTGPFNPLSKQFNPDVKPWPHDVQRATSLLAEAGFADRNRDGIIEGPDGKPFRFRLTYPSGNPNYDKMVLFMKDAYARAGVVLEPDPLDWAVMVDRLNKKEFQAITLGWSAGIESDIYQMFHSSQAVEEGDNFVSYKNPELDRVIHQARTTIDESQRMPLWRQAHAILHEDQPYTFLSFGKSLVFIDNRISNVEITKIGLNPRAEWFVPAGQQRWTK